MEGLIGKRVFFRAVTYHLIGVLKAVTDQECILEGGTVMWVADDGRFTECFTKGPVETEVYGYKDVGVGRGSLVDWTEFPLSEMEYPVKQR